MQDASVSTSAPWALVVDDHPLFCDALVLTLRSVTDYRRIRTANSLASALESVAENGRPDIIVLDLNLPDVHGLDGLIRMKGAARDTAVIVVSSMTENRVIGAALAAGASGYVAKHSPRSVIKDAVDTIRAGGTYVPEGYTAPRRAADLAEAGQRLASLTNQQRRILSLICEGRLNKQIAYELSIAETTVKAHMTAIMRKLGVQSRTQAVLVAQELTFDGNLPSVD